MIGGEKTELQSISDNFKENPGINTQVKRVAENKK